LKDESLKQYRGKFPNKPKQEITRNYACQTYLRPDSTKTDSTSLEDIDLPDDVPVSDEPTPNE